MKSIAVLSLFLAVLLISGIVMAQNQNDNELKIPINSVSDKAQAVSGDTAAIAIQNDRVIAYYFHGTRRCATCKKLETYSKEAIEKGFEKELKSGRLEFLTIDVDEKENEHFVKEYQLFTKALILSRVKDGKEIGWNNLDKIWDLVGDEKEYVEYVQTELKKFWGEK